MACDFVSRLYGPLSLSNREAAELVKTYHDQNFSMAVKRPGGKDSDDEYKEYYAALQEYSNNARWHKANHARCCSVRLPTPVEHHRDVGSHLRSLNRIGRFDVIIKTCVPPKHDELRHVQKTSVDKIQITIRASPYRDLTV